MQYHFLHRFLKEGTMFKRNCDLLLNGECGTDKNWAHKGVQKLMLSKNVNNKSSSPNQIFLIFEIEN